MYNKEAEGERKESDQDRKGVTNVPRNENGNLTKRRNRTVQGDGRASGPRRGKRRPDQIASRLQGAKGKQKGHAKRSSEWEREVQGMTEG